MYGSKVIGEIQVVVDDKEPANITQAAGSLLELDVFYASPLLDNAMHKVVFINVFEMSIDYALVGVEKNTPLLEHNIIVGSDDPDIQYKGTWSKNSTSIEDSFGSLSRRPFGNSTAQTGSTNSSFLFQFYGTFVSVVGAAPVENCTAMWIFDDGTTSIDYLGQDNTLFEWFSTDSIFLGNHTLGFQGISSPTGNAMFTLEYIIYTPSRSTLDAVPNGTIIPGSASSSSTGSNPSVTPTKPSATLHRLSNAGITGVAIGAVAGVAATFLVLIIFLRMKRRTTRIGRIEQDVSIRTANFRPVDPYPEPEVLPDDIIQHKSSIPRITVGQANTIETHYILPTDTLGGIEHRSLFQRIMGAVTRRSRLTRVEPYRGLSYWVHQSDLTVQHKPPLSDTHNVITINQPIRETRDRVQDEDDNTTVTGTETVVAQEGDTMSRAEHLRRLILEFQQELAESGSVAHA
ncbi:hypothetical protein DXG01_009213 [Tephrocybe rancida]|nr:hypothetical protein DXG01_009213 [Tephrocybe rancida]